MNAADNPLIEVLLNASARDQRTLQHPVDDEVFGFHAQQGIEKLLKVLITAHGEEFPLTHDLHRLAQQLFGLGETLPSLPCTFSALNAYAVDARDDAGEPLSAQQRAELRTALDVLRSFVNERRQALNYAGTKVREP